MIVADSSAIIALGKQGVLHLLKKCFTEAMIPESVYEEVSRKHGSTEAAAIDQALEEKWVSVEKIGVHPLLVTENIGKGEKEAISLAAKRKTTLLADDEIAKSYAAILGVETHGTLYIIFLSCQKKIITKEKAVEIVKGMISEGLYISTEVYSKFTEMIDTIGKDGGK